MDIVLPDRGRLADVERRIAAGGLNRLVTGLATTPVALSLPKLDLESG